jgi:hypothetical protein
VGGLVTTEACAVRKAGGKREPVVKKVIIAITGGTVVLIGIAMIVLPGPALLVIPAGLAILATEFLWARHALKKCQELAHHTKRHARRWWPFRRKPAPSIPPEQTPS